MAKRMECQAVDKTWEGKGEYEVLRRMELYYPRSCDYCRKRKIRCSRTKPTCHLCSKKGHPCTRNNPFQKRGPKSKRARLAIEMEENLNRAIAASHKLTEWLFDEVNDHKGFPTSYSWDHPHSDLEVPSADLNNYNQLYDQIIPNAYWINAHTGDGPNLMPTLEFTQLTQPMVGHSPETVHSQTHEQTPFSLPNLPQLKPFPPAYPNQGYRDFPGFINPLISQTFNIPPNATKLGLTPSQIFP
ncbi:hypothetical protein L0F63_003756 [Massospora cicadina]|nr:hypothetical protein L0F63_003756 [Massospora cicadina]